MTRQRMNAGDRSEMILGEALRLFAERHFSNVTMRELALACDVNVALIYYYFENKEQLFQAALQLAIGRIHEHFEKQRARRTDPMATIVAWIEVPAEIVPMVVRMVKVMADYAAATTRDPALDAMIAEFYERERVLLERSIRRGIASKRFRRVDVRRTARFIGLHLDGIFHASPSRGDNRILSDLADLTEMTRRILIA